MAEVVKSKAYRVTLYATVRVPVDVPSAESQLDAIAKAEAAVNLHRDFRGGEYAEEVTRVLVAEVGDDDFLDSRTYIPDLDTGIWVVEHPDADELATMTLNDFSRWSLAVAPALIAAANLEFYMSKLPATFQASAHSLAEQAKQELDAVVRKYYGFGIGDYFRNYNGKIHYLEGYTMPDGYETPRMVAPLVNQDGSISKRSNEFLFGITGFQKVDPKDIETSK